MGDDGDVMAPSEYLGRDELDRMLVECGAVKFGKFTLTSGKKSDYYVDVKLASTKPAILAQIAAGMGEIIKGEFPGADLLSGMELGAVPICAATALQTGIDYLILRKKPRSHGTASQIEGSYRSGARVVILEDVTTTGGSVIRSAKILRSAGLEVIGAITVVDRQEGAGEEMKRSGIAFRSLTTAESLRRLKGN